MASDDVVRGGVACELVHLGSLYHDDVIDESDTRRGVETVNAKWGNLQAILAGDFLLSKASEIAASLGTEVAALLARTIGWLCQGEVEQLRHTYDVARTEDSYLSSITGKTAALFGTAARIGGIVAGLDRPVVDTLTQWGSSFGMVFQIVDDILDITGTSGSWASRPATTWSRACTPCRCCERWPWTTVSAPSWGNSSASRSTCAERDKALAVVRASEGVQSAATTARRYIAEAEAACDDLPAGRATDALRTAPAALLQSALTPV